MFFFQFRDLQALPTLFELHTVLCSVPASNFFAMEIAAVSMQNTKHTVHGKQCAKENGLHTVLKLY